MKTRVQQIEEEGMNKFQKLSLLTYFTVPYGNIRLFHYEKRKSTNQTVQKTYFSVLSREIVFTCTNCTRIFPINTAATQYSYLTKYFAPGIYPDPTRI